MQGRSEMRAKMVAVVATAAVALSACNRQPVEPSDFRRVSAPAYDEGGHTYGSGNLTAPAPGTTTAATQTSEAAVDTTTRGGHTYGSGN